MIQDGLLAVSPSLVLTICGTKAGLNSVEVAVQVSCGKEFREKIKPSVWISRKASKDKKI